MSCLTSLRFRSVCLVLGLLCSLPSTASACCFLPLLDPFHWLFGCSRHYGPGHLGGYGGYGNPHATHRFIDDWLGYGYLRNQQGTLGHYPGRPFGCYQPQYPGMLDPCAPCAPVMPAPMVAPMQQPMMPMPMPTMHEPCFDPGQIPCEDPCMPMPLVMQMPGYPQVPGYARRPRRVRVPRRQRMLMQPQFMMPGPMSSAPMMSMPMMDMGCDSCCDGGVSAMPYDESMGQSVIAPDAGGVADSGCCGGAMGLDASAMMMAPDYASCMPDCDMMPYTTMSQWYAPGPGLTTMPSLTRRQTRIVNQFERRFMRTLRTPRSRHMPYGSAWPGTMGWTPQMAPMTWQSGYNTMPGYGPMQAALPYDDYGYESAMYDDGYGYPMPYQTAMTPPMPMQRWQPMPSRMVAGDIAGDHELPASTAAIPVTPNAFRGTARIAPAVFSNPFNANAVRRYDNVVR